MRKQKKTRVQFYVKKTKESEITFHTHYFSFTDSINFLDFLNKTAPKLYNMYFDDLHNQINKKVVNLKEKEKKEFDNTTKYLKKKKGAMKNIKSKNVQNLFGMIEDIHIHMQKMNSVLLEMSLMYLISEFEELLKKQLDLIFKKYPKMLSGKTLTYESIIGKKEKDIQKEVIEKQLQDIISEDIEKINQFLIGNTKLDLSKYKHWKKFCERFYRRNIITHNNGYPDKKYFQKTGRKKSSKKLIITTDYFNKSLTIFEQISHYITDYFEEKYGLKKIHKGKFVYLHVSN